MRKPQGNFFYCDPDPASWQPGTIECDSYTCRHCSTFKRVPVGVSPTSEYTDPMNGRREQAFICRCCNDDEYICAACKKRGGCMPIEVMCELIEGPIRKLEAAIRENESKRRFAREVFGIR